MTPNTKPTDEQVAKELNLDNLEYLGGGYFRDKTIPKGEHAEIIHGPQMLGYARELKEQLEHALNPIHSCGNDCQRPACVMRRERDALKKQVEDLQSQLDAYKWKHW